MNNCLLVVLFIGIAYSYVIPKASTPAEIARYIIQTTDWASIATLSQSIEGYPFVAVKSFSDGTQNRSTGIPYLFMTDMDISAQDLLVNDRLALTASLAQTNYCKENDLDPQSPFCGRIMLVGRYVKVNSTSEEHDFGKVALVEKHPEMATWPEDHGFYVAKLDIEYVLLLYRAGGIANVSLADYYAAEPNNTVVLN